MDRQRRNIKGAGADWIGDGPDKRDGELWTFAVLLTLNEYSGGAEQLLI